MVRLCCRLLCKVLIKFLVKMCGRRSFLDKFWLKILLRFYIIVCDMILLFEKEFWFKVIVNCLFLNSFMIKFEKN